MRSSRPTVIAETGDRFSDFFPYVASIDDRGVVAFQAALTAGGTGVFTGSGGPISTVVDSRDGPFGDICSHPDIDDHGSVSFYATLRAGGQGVFRVGDGAVVTIAETGTTRLVGIGPLGPTMSHDGTVAFRADLDRDTSGVFTGAGGVITTVARTGAEFAGFEGLPVVNRRGAVVFRANLEDGGQGIYLHDPLHDPPHDPARGSESLVTIADTRGRFRSLARFPIIDDAGTVAFAGTLATGRQGIFTVAEGELTTVVDGDDGPFESFRGVLVGGGAVVFYATPTAGRIGIYSLIETTAERILGIGDELLGSSIAGFVLNPVSINNSGQVAIRIELADVRQAIVRVQTRIGAMT